MYICYTCADKHHIKLEATFTNAHCEICFNRAALAWTSELRRPIINEGPTVEEQLRQREILFSTASLQFKKEKSLPDTDIYTASYTRPAGEVIRVECSYRWTQIRMRDSKNKFEEWVLKEGDYTRNDGDLCKTWPPFEINWLIDQITSAKKIANEAPDTKKKNRPPCNTPSTTTKIIP